MQVVIAKVGFAVFIKLKYTMPEGETRRSLAGDLPLPKDGYTALT